MIAIVDDVTPNRATVLLYGPWHEIRDAYYGPETTEDVRLLDLDDGTEIRIGERIWHSGEFASADDLDGATRR